MNESRRGLLQSLLAVPAVPAVVAVGVKEPQVVENKVSGKTLLVFRLTQPAPAAAVEQCKKEIREWLDVHFAGCDGIVLPAYMELSAVHAIPEGAENCSV